MQRNMSVDADFFAFDEARGSRRSSCDFPKASSSRASRAASFSEAAVNSQLEHSAGNAKQRSRSSSMTADGQRSSLLGAFFNLATTTLGAGILTLPFFYSQVNSRRGSEMPTCAEASWLQAGILLGSGFIVFIASLSAFSLHLLLACQRKTLRSSYMEVAHAAFGEPGRVVRIRFSSCGCEYG
jgi:hypothetical protein